MAAYAGARESGIWQWYAETVGAGDPQAPVSILRETQQKPIPTAPPPGASLKVFQKAGWAVFNTDLRDALNGVQLMLRASPYGNISHSHADQNNIVLAAYGSPLLVNTGVRDYYGSPFCKEWYWATKAHNSILIGGREQERGSGTTAQIVSSGHDGTLMYAVGDATKAYSSGAELYRRWIAMLSETDILMLDEVETSESEVQLLFHARKPFEYEPRTAVFKVGHDKASLSAAILSDTSVAFAMTDRYTTEPMPGTKTVPEWHLTASLKSPHPEGTRHILTALRITRGNVSGQGPKLSDFRSKGNEVVVNWDNRIIRFKKKSKQVTVQE
jgi:Heparinase II/III-like protein